MQKYLLAGSIITIENPKDFFGEIKEDSYVIVTHDYSWIINYVPKTTTSAWLTSEELKKAVQKARKWSFVDQLKLRIRRFVLPIILSKQEIDDMEYLL